MRQFVLLGVGIAMLVAPVGSVFAAGDAEKGKAAYAKCAICHRVGPDAQVLVGPPLTGVVGRTAASYPDFSYSPGMRKLGEEGYVWTEAHIDEFIADPKGLLPTSPMSLTFQGIESAEERANIIAYLKTFSQ